MKVVAEPRSRHEPADDDITRDRTMRALGSVIVAQALSPWAVRLRDHRGTHVDALALCLNTRATTWRVAGDALHCPTDGGLLIDLSQGAGLSCDGTIDLLLLAPRRMLPTWGAPRVAAEPVGGSAALTSLRRLATTLLHMGGTLTDAQARVAGQAVAESMTAVLAPQRVAAGGLAPRREASLLDQLISHVDAHLTDDLTIEMLCRSLNCSRSALYRAAGALGGVAALVGQRRLAAVHERLCDPTETRAIGDLARAHGLPEPTRFSRMFKRRYGVTAMGLRRGRRADRRRPDQQCGF